MIQRVIMLECRVRGGVGSCMLSRTILFVHEYPWLASPSIESRRHWCKKSVTRCICVEGYYGSSIHPWTEDIHGYELRRYIFIKDVPF